MWGNGRGYRWRPGRLGLGLGLRGLPDRFGNRFCSVLLWLRWCRLSSLLRRCHCARFLSLIRRLRGCLTGHRNRHNGRVCSLRRLLLWVLLLWWWLLLWVIRRRYDWFAAVDRLLDGSIGFLLVFHLRTLSPGRFLLDARALKNADGRRSLQPDIVFGSNPDRT